jgi:asparagine synthase (glutamine-hydrolysing)
MTATDSGLWGVCGWFGDPPPGMLPELVLAQMTADFTDVGGSSLVDLDPRGSVFLSPGTPGRELAVDDNLCVALFGHQLWWDEDLKAEARRVGNAAAALFGYRRLGRSVISRLHGAFGLRILDRRRGEGLIAIDRLGIHPMSFSRQGRGVVFATTATAVARHPGIGAQVSSQGLFNYLFFYRVPAPGTIFNGIDKLMPGQVLHVGAGKAETFRYWQLPFSNRSRVAFSELKEGLFTSLRTGVRRATDGEEWDRIGTFLSGGLDSSSVTGLVSELSPVPVKAFTIGFDSLGYDEREYARLTADRFSVDHRIYEITPTDVLNSLSLIAAAFDEPFGNASAVPVYYCARFAKNQGVDTLIAGDGGDELFAGNAAHLQMKIFELYGRVPPFIRNRLIEPTVNCLPAGQWNILGRKARSYIDRANIAMPDRMFSAECELVARASDIVDPERLASIDPEQPLEILREAYRRPAAASFEQRVHQLELQVILADNDLRKVGRMCALAGLAVRFPLLDEAVCEFSAALPPELLLRGLKLRAFFKEAMRGFLPGMTLKKRKHGFGLPVGPWLSPGTRLQELAYDCLSSLKGRRLLRAEYIGGLIDRHSRDPRPFNANPIWDLMMLELWLTSHSGLFGRPAKSISGNGH